MFRPLLTIALAVALPVSAGVAVAQDAREVPYDAGLLSACLTAAGSDPQSCIGKASSRCMETPDGSTTVGMVSCTWQELDQWDAMLHDSYGALIAQSAKADAELAALGSAASPSEPGLRDAQRKWLAWRDAECRFAALQFQGGTGGGPAANGCAMRLTAERALALDGMLGDGR